MSQPIVVMHPNAALRLSPVASALARAGILSRATVMPLPMFSVLFHREIARNQEVRHA